MPIDNRWYDDLGDKWWDPSGPVSPLHDLNPARFAYFSTALGSLAGLRLLDVGCGGGLLATKFAEAGAAVTGVDLSVSSVATGLRHARDRNIQIEFAAARGESLPFADGEFDAVVSSDFLEHVTDLDSVVAEIARVVKPAGLFLYETVNRTLRARIVTVWLLERVLSLIPRNTHDADMFIKPSELHQIMTRHGLKNIETRGIEPEAGPLGALAGFIKHGRAGNFKITQDTAIAYIGYAIKSA